MDVRAVEGVFTAEERTRYVIPEEVRCLLPVPYHKLVPASSPTVEEGRPASALPAAASSRPVTAAVPTVENHANTPWGNWLAALPRWSWLEAETLPTPKAVVLPSSLTRHEPPALPPAVSKSKGAKESSGHPVPRHPTGGTTHRKQAPVESKSVLPVPSLRARGICPYELRRHRLATAGRELQREADCPLGIQLSTRPNRIHSLSFQIS